MTIHKQILSPYNPDHMSGSISDYDLMSQKLDEVKRQIDRDWKSYKKSRLMLHGAEVPDNRLDMLLVFLIKRGFFDE